MDKVKFIIGEIQTLAYDLNAITNHYNWREEQNDILKMEWANEEKERKEKGENLPVARMVRPAQLFNDELVIIRNRLNLVINYLDEGKVQPLNL